MKGAMLFVFALFALSVLRPAAAGAIDCPICEFLVGQAEKYVAENNTQAEIITYMDDACKILTSQKWITDCEGLVSTYAPQIIQKLVAKETPAQICTDLSLCTSAKLRGAIDCPICEFVAAQAEKYVAENNTQAEIITYLDDACKILTSQKWVTDCTSLVATYAPQIIQKLVAKETPEQICTDLTLCTSSAAVPEPIKKEEALECPLCEWLVGQAEKYVAENATEAEIITYLDDACKVLTGQKWITACDGLVATYAPQIIQSLVNKETPDQICALLTLCSNASSVAAPAPVQPIKKEGSLECTLCALIVGYAEKYVEQNKTINETLTFIEGECKLLHDKAWITTCQGAVATYGPQIIQLVINKEPADVICSQVGLCSNSTAKATTQIHIAPTVVAPLKGDGNLTCSICQYLVTAVEGFIAANKTESEIIDGLDDVCAILKPIETACKNMVGEYGDLIVAYLINEEPPGVVCTEIKLCSSSSDNFSIYNTKKLSQ